MSVLFARIYYLLMTVIIFYNLPFLLTRNFGQKNFVGFAYFLNFLPEPSLILIALSFLLLICLGFCLWNLNQLCRIAAAVIASILTFSAFSFGKINHPTNVWLISAFLMIFFDPKRGFREKPNLYIYDLIQTVILTTYFISGLWKLRDWWSAGSSFDFQSSILSAVAYSIAEGNGPSPVLYPLLDHQAWVFVFGFFVMLLFQLTTVFAVFVRKYRPLWGCFAVFFIPWWVSPWGFGFLDKRSPQFSFCSLFL